MKKPLKFDIKVSFTSDILKNNNDNNDISSFFDNLLNKKINIHLKINLDKIQQEFQKKKLYFSQNNSTNNSIDDIIVNNSIDEKSDDSIIELEKEITPKLTHNIILNDKLKIHKNFTHQKYTKKNNSTLVLDLDETLVYVTDFKIENSPLKQIPFEYYIIDESEDDVNQSMMNKDNQTLDSAKNYLIIRPGFTKFITEVKKYFDEIFVFTSSQYYYAEEIIKIIDKNKIISKIYSRKDCSFYNEIFYKDLNKIKKDLSKTIIIDNFPEAYLLQHFNGLPIPSFMGDPNDNELLKLLPILKQLSKVIDVRNYIREIVTADGESVIFNKAYELLKIKKEEKNNNSKMYNSVNDKNCQKKMEKILKNIKGNNNWKKNNLKISELIEKSNNKTIENDSNEKIIVNDIDNYFYLEKNLVPLSTLVQNNNKNDTKSKSINQRDVNNSNKNKIKKKNLILENLYNNKRYNHQMPLLTNSMININNNKNRYELQKTQRNISSSKNIVDGMNNSYSQNIIPNSSKHFKCKSLLNSEINLFDNKMAQSLDISRNSNNKKNLSFRTHRIISLKNN